MKSVKLNFLEPSGKIQACNGTALPYSLTKHLFSCVFVIPFLAVLPVLELTRNIFVTSGKKLSPAVDKISEDKFKFFFYLRNVVKAENVLV